MQLHKILLATAATLSIGMLAGTAHAYDPVLDFSIASNSGVNGVWSYGQTSVLGGGFTLLANAVPADALNPSLESWQGSTPGFSGGYPVILHNPSGVPQSYGPTATSQPDELLFHPGPTSEYSVLRFVVPASGSYQLLGTFTGRDSGPATTNVSILLNSGVGSPLFTGDININGGGNAASFNLTQSFSAGDTLDFSIGDGNGTYFNDSTGLKLSVASSSAPEPGTLAFLALGGTLVIVHRRRKL